MRFEQFSFTKEEPAQKRFLPRLRIEVLAAVEPLAKRKEVVAEMVEKATRILETSGYEVLVDSATVKRYWKTDDEAGTAVFCIFELRFERGA